MDHLKKCTKIRWNFLREKNGLTHRAHMFCFMKILCDNVLNNFILLIIIIYSIKHIFKIETLQIFNIYLKKLKKCLIYN